MLFKLATIVCIVITAESRQSYFIKGPGWIGEVEKCWYAGDDSHARSFHIGTLESTGLKYEDINHHTSVKVHGYLELHTKASGPEVEKDRDLKLSYDDVDCKEFSTDWKRAAASGWAKQTVAVSLTVKITREGSIVLKSYVYAGSWRSVSCAHAKAIVDTIEIENLDASGKNNSNGSSELSSKDLLKNVLAKVQASQKKHSNAESKVLNSELLKIVQTLQISKTKYSNGSSVISTSGQLKLFCIVAFYTIFSNFLYEYC